LVALGLALSLGTVASITGAGWIEGFADGVAPIGGIWISALRMTVIPLVLTQLLTALTSADQGAAVGGLGIRALALCVALLCSVGTITLVAMAPIMTWAPIDTGTAVDLLSRTTVPAEATQTAVQSAASLADWIQNLVPQNVFAAAASGEILPLLVVTILLGFAANRLEPDQRSLLASLFGALANAMMQIVFWVLWLTPVAVFALVLGLSVSVGTAALGILLFYVLAVTGWMLVVSGALYPISALFGQVSIRDFAKALVPAHMVAVSTRSSLASLPALISGGRDHLRFPSTITGFVLPFSSSLFKLSTVTAEPVRYLFLAHILGLDVTLPQTATFLLTLILLSFAGVGIPRGGSGFDTLPAYAAAGIPIEGLVLVVAVDTVPDIAKTLINVTGHMTVATITSRTRKSGAT
jgi:Na+/H+-dicarboxylate symporter